jgi:hypothetical protein
MTSGDVKMPENEIQITMPKEKLPKSGEVFEYNGQHYLRIDDKAIPVEIVNGQPVPTIKAESVTTPNENGGQDVTVKVPCLKIVGGMLPPGQV